ncbi:hypothetical protein T08_12450 [Trichinella sp. T8]|nr:hypothetical protein T08_12450 [Trichinella sp. T8]
MHIRRPSASSIVPVSLSKGSPPEVICQRDSGITETTAPVSSNKQTLVPLSLPFTHGVSSACSPAMDNSRRVPGLPLCVPVAGRTAVSSYFSSFREIFLISHIKLSMDWIASAFSGFGLLVSSELRQGLMVPAAASSYTPASRLFPVPRGHVLIRRLCVQPLPPLGRIARWFSLRVDAGRGTARSAVLWRHAQQSFLELLEGILPCLSRGQVASDHAVVRGRNSAGAEKVFQPLQPPNGVHVRTKSQGRAIAGTSQAHSLPPSCYLRVRRYLATGRY